MESPRVSIISINYNQAEMTRAMLDSLRLVSYPNVEVIIVDNASKNREIESLEAKYPEAKFIFSEENLGFSGGNNLGIEAATGELYLFLNNDTEVDKDFLQPMVEAFENKSIGMVSPKIKYFDTNIIQYAGNSAVSPYTGRSTRTGYKEEDNGQHDIAMQTELVHGAAMMVPKNVVDKVGVMPEIFFLYYEEIDWCETIKRAEYEIWYIPQSTVFHKESMSIGKTSTLKTYYMTRNRIIFLRRSTSGLSKLSWMIFFAFLTVPKNVLTYLLKFQFDHLKAFTRGILWNLSNFTVT